MSTVTNYQYILDFMNKFNKEDHYLPEQYKDLDDLYDIGEDTQQDLQLASGYKVGYDKVLSHYYLFNLREKELSEKYKNPVVFTVRLGLKKLLQPVEGKTYALSAYGADVACPWAEVVVSVANAFGIKIYYSVIDNDEASKSWWQGMKNAVYIALRDNFYTSDEYQFKFTIDDVDVIPGILFTDGKVYFPRYIVNAIKNYLLTTGVYDSGDDSWKEGNVHYGENYSYNDTELTSVKAMLRQQIDHIKEKVKLDEFYKTHVPNPLEDPYIGYDDAVNDILEDIYNNFEDKSGLGALSINIIADVSRGSDCIIYVNAVTTDTTLGKADLISEEEFPDHLRKRMITDATYDSAGIEGTYANYYKRFWVNKDGSVGGSPTTYKRTDQVDSWWGSWPNIALEENVNTEMYSFESFNIGEIKSESKTPPAVEPHDDPKPTPPKPTPPEPKNPEPKQPTPPKPVNPKEPWEEWPKPKSYKKKSKYKVIFKDYDGVTLKTGTYKRGTLLLNMKPSKPKRESTSKYNFKFAGWSVNGSIVSDSYMLLDNTVFTAKYTKSQIKKPTPSTKKYNYTFKNWDGSVLKEGETTEGTELKDIKPTNPTREETEEFTYKFLGWLDADEGNIVTNDYEIEQAEIFVAKYDATRKKDKEDPRPKVIEDDDDYWINITIINNTNIINNYTQNDSKQGDTDDDTFDEVNNKQNEKHEQEGTVIPVGRPNLDTGITSGFPTLFNLNNTGMCHIYVINTPNLKNLGSWLWSDNFFENITSKMWKNDPLKALISLHAVPVNLTNLSIDYKPIIFGNAEVPNSLGLNVDSRVEDVDCGSLSLNEYFEDSRDFNPYTKASLYLPFIGIVPLEIDDFQTGIISVKYRVDVATGDCIASVIISRNKMIAQLYSFSGNCAVQIPISSADYLGLRTGQVANIAGIGMSLSKGNILGAALGVAGTINQKTDVQQAGGIGGSICGALGIRKPYLIINRPIQCESPDFNKFEGIPSQTTQLLKNCSGFTKIKECHLDGIPATDEEIEEIYTLLKQGVIL